MTLRRTPRSVLGGAGLLLALSAALAPGAAAQGSGDGFLFREPTVTFGIRGGFDRAIAGSDIFSFTTENLTVGRGDFSGPTVGADLAVRITPRLALALGAGYSGTQAASEFRDWVDLDDRPIEQTTTFQRVPLTAGARFYLAPRGRSIGRFAWIPERYAPYVGVAAGGMWYRFRQQGDFVDFQTEDIFPDVLESTGWTPMAQALAGAEVTLTPHLALTGDARYNWARATPDAAFEGFDPFDLSGLAASVGISIRF